MTLSASLRQLAESPPTPLSGKQWAIVTAATVLAALTRLLTLARAPWDWDEFLFVLAIDHFDVARHHPHPPGFPLFIFGAKVLRTSGFDNFHALQAMSVLAAMTIVPAMFFLCRQLRLPFTTSMSAGLLLAFFPNVWFFGGTAFSDVPSMTLIVLAMALLLAGCRDGRAYIAGSLLLAVAAGFRPQNLLIGIVPLLIASAFQLRRCIGRVLAAACAIVIIIGLSYGAAAWLTGWTSYAETNRMHARFIASTDSFLGPQRPSLWSVFVDFFIRPYRAPLINALVTLFAVISIGASIVRRRWLVLVPLASFAPFCVFAWLMLDRLSTGRFSIGYAPLMALLAADGIRLATRRDLAELLVETIMLTVMIAWAWPAFADLRSTVPPPAAAAEWIREHAAPEKDVVYVGESMGPAAERYLRDYRRLPGASAPAHAYELREGRARGGVTFAHPRDRLWKIVRRRYFEVTVVAPARSTS